MNPQELDMFNEEAWPASYDDREIDDIIWSEIADSTSKGDFVCYLINRLAQARHRNEAEARIAAMSETDRSLPVGYARAAERILALAESGHAGAMFHIGKLYVHGIGVAQDMRKAEKWYQRAIDAGEMRAHCNMGWIYLYGFGVIPADKKRAYELLSIGAASGIPAAKASIGLMRITGDGIEPDLALGLKLLEESFDEGYLNAGNHLSDMYFAGKYVEKDIEKAHDWLLRVAEKGDERTMAILGHYLATGSHGKTDAAKGIELLEKAIDMNYVPAYLWLGNLYKEGKGLGKDLAKAREWFEKGAAAGNTGCTLALTMLLVQGRPATGSSGGMVN